MKLGLKITQHQADVLFEHDLERFEAGVARLCPNLNENQFSAIVSFAYNFGLHALETSKLRRALPAIDQLTRWIHIDGVESPGLVARRAAEKELFLTPVLPHSFPTPPGPPETA